MFLTVQGGTSCVHALPSYNTSAVIGNPAKREVRGVIRFLWAKNHSVAEIHRELWPKHYD